MWAFYSSPTHMDWRQAVERRLHTCWIGITGKQLITAEILTPEAAHQHCFWVLFDFQQLKGLFAKKYFIYLPKFCFFLCPVQQISIQLMFGCFDKISHNIFIFINHVFSVHSREYQSNRLKKS